MVAPPQEDSSQRSLLLTGPGGSPWCAMRDPMCRSRQGADGEGQDLGHMPLFGSRGGVLWGSIQFNSNQNWSFVSYMGVSSKECIRGRHCEVGRLLSPRATGKSYEKLTLT